MPVRHPNFPVVVQAAQLRAQKGFTQVAAAKAVGVSERTVQRWEANEEMWCTAVEANGDPGPDSIPETWQADDTTREVRAAPALESKGTTPPRRHNLGTRHEKRVSAAYLRMLGATQKETAAAVGCGERTLQSWEADPSWAEYRAEARDRWMADVDDRARARILDGLAKNPEDTLGAAKLGLQLLERLDPNLAPATRKVDVRLGILQRLMQLPPEQLRKIEAMTDDQVAGLLTGEVLDV